MMLVLIFLEQLLAKNRLSKVQNTSYTPDSILLFLIF